MLQLHEVNILAENSNWVPENTAGGKSCLTARIFKLVNYPNNLLIFVPDLKGARPKVCQR